MLKAGGNKGKTERRGRKAESRKRAGGQQGPEAEPRPDQLQDVQEQINELQDTQEQISASVASSDISPLETYRPCCIGRARRGQPGNDRQCLWRLHREIGRTDLVLPGKRGRAVAR